MKNRTLKKLLCTVISSALMFSMAACSHNRTNGDDAALPSEETGEVQLSTTEEISALSLQEIPEAYLQPCDQAGRVVRLDYTTNTYDAGSRDMEKYAFVYLPYGYDETDEAIKYPVFYLMHGWTGDAELYLGGEGGDRPLKRIFDRLIANGDMQPMIIVTPTYYKDNREQGNSIQEEDALLTANFYHELQNDLIPAVESRYHTYAETVDAQGIRASRDYRIFGGFSMGAVTTWYVFLNCLDSFRYYMPISGDCWEITKTDMGTKDTADETARYLHDFIQNSGYTASDYNIYALTGTNDMAQDALDALIEAMKLYPDSFIYSDTADRGNLFYQKAVGGVHDYTSMIQYIYNALPVFGKLMRAGGAADYISVEGQQVKITTANSEVIVTLNGSRAAADLVKMLPLELTLIERNHFAKGMTLPEHLSSEEATTREYEIGDFGYWDAGPDLAIFYDDIYEQTIVEVIPLGHAESGAQTLAEESGTVMLEFIHE